MSSRRTASLGRPARSCEVAAPPSDVTLCPISCCCSLRAALVAWFSELSDCRSLAAAVAAAPVAVVIGTAPSRVEGGEGEGRREGGVRCR